MESTLYQDDFAVFIVTIYFYLFRVCVFFFVFFGRDSLFLVFFGFVRIHIFFSFCSFLLSF